MNAPQWPDLLYVNLGWGRDRAKTLGSLAEAMNAPRRALEQATEQLRRDGAPIVTCSAGLYLSTDDRELAAAAKALQARAVTVMLGARALRATARRYREQRLRVSRRNEIPLTQSTLFGDAA